MSIASGTAKSARSGQSSRYVPSIKLQNPTLSQSTPGPSKIPIPISQKDSSHVNEAVVSQIRELLMQIPAERLTELFLDILSTRVDLGAILEQYARAPQSPHQSAFATARSIQHTEKSPLSPDDSPLSPLNPSFVGPTFSSRWQPTSPSGLNPVTLSPEPLQSSYDPSPISPGQPSHHPLLTPVLDAAQPGPLVEPTKSPALPPQKSSSLPPLPPPSEPESEHEPDQDMISLSKVTDTLASTSAKLREFQSLTADLDLSNVDRVLDGCARADAEFSLLTATTQVDLADYVPLPHRSDKWRAKWNHHMELLNISLARLEKEMSLFPLDSLQEPNPSLKAARHNTRYLRHLSMIFEDECDSMEASRGSIERLILRLKANQLSRQLAQVRQMAQVRGRGVSAT